MYMYRYHYFVLCIGTICIHTGVICIHTGTIFYIPVAFVYIQVPFVCIHCRVPFGIRTSNVNFVKTILEK